MKRRSSRLGDAGSPPTRRCIPFLALLAIGSFLFAPVPAAATPASKTTILVFPLEDQTKSPELAWLGEGIALALTEQLRVPETEVVERDERVSLVETADLPPSLPLSRASMIRVGQQAAVDAIVLGSYSGDSQNLRVSARFLDLRTWRFGGEMSAHGPLSALPELENQLAWDILGGAGLCSGCSRDGFRQRTRTVQNVAYSFYVRGLAATDEEEQVRLLQRAVALHKDFPAALLLLGRHYVASGDCVNGVLYLEPAVRSGRVQGESLFMLGTCHLSLGRLDAAIPQLSTGLSFRRSPEALNNLGVAYLRKRDYTVAADYLAEARRLAPQDPSVALNLAVLRCLNGNPQAALPVLEDAVRSNPASGMLLYLLSVVLESSGDGERAASTRARAVQLGVDINRLKTEDPRTWTRVLSPWLFNR